MYINDSFQVILSDIDATEILLNGSQLRDLVVDSNNKSWVDELNKNLQFFDMSEDLIKTQDASNNPEYYFSECVKNWNIPESYKSINIDEYILQKCQTQIEIDRVHYELQLFKEKQLENLIKFLIYFVETLRANNIFWGVGRGSSVSSYVLFLIGVHKIDSLKYNLDIKEFLK